MADADPLGTLTLELRRGAIVLAVLARLRREHYAYSLCKSLSEKGLNVDEGTLYPLVRRLEKQGLLVSEWREEAKRRKRFYTISPAGREVLDRLLDEWRGMNASIATMLAEG